MRYVVALFLFAHGVAHTVGFAAGFRLSPEVPAMTSILGGRVPLGEVGARVVGLAWLLHGLGFATVAVAVAMRWSWAFPALVAVALACSLMCVVGWPQARVGLVLDAAVLVAVAGVWVFGVRRP